VSIITRLLLPERDPGRGHYNIREAIEVSLEIRLAQGFFVQITPVEITEIHLAVNG
jgi:hypothetical protein